MVSFNLSVMPGYHRSDELVVWMYTKKVDKCDKIKDK